VVAAPVKDPQFNVAIYIVRHHVAVDVYDNGILLLSPRPYVGRFRVHSLSSKLAQSFWQRAKE
jgi:hypothetical protein